MLRHADVWRAIDRMAEKYGMSASGLARRAGLDPTTFNKSKRNLAKSSAPEQGRRQSYSLQIATRFFALFAQFANRTGAVCPTGHGPGLRKLLIFHLFRGGLRKITPGALFGTALAE